MESSPPRALHPQAKQQHTDEEKEILGAHRATARQVESSPPPPFRPQRKQQQHTDEEKEEKQILGAHRTTAIKVSSPPPPLRPQRKQHADDEDDTVYTYPRAVEPLAIPRSFSYMHQDDAMQDTTLPAHPMSVRRSARVQQSGAMRDAIMPTYPASVQPSAHAQDTTENDQTATVPTTSMPIVILRENKLPAKFNDYVFAEAENPRSRVRQFQHLKDNALFKRIEDLPAWQQMQEMVPWFRPVDGIIVYLHDVEGYHVRWSPTAIRQPDSFASQLQKMGFPGDLVFRLRLVYSAYRRISKNLERFLTVLAGSTPVHVGLGLPTPGVTQTTFSTHSPTTATIL